MQKCVKLNAE